MNSNVGNKIFYTAYYLIAIGVITFLLIFCLGFLLKKSEGLGLLLFPLLFFFFPPLLSLIISIIVYKDAKKLKKQGANIESPILWALVSYFLFGLAIYLSFRKIDFKKQIQGKILS